MRFKDKYLNFVDVMVLTAVLLLFAVPITNAQTAGNPSAETTRAYVQAWNEIQALKQSDSDIPADLYERYFSLEALIYPPDTDRGRQDGHLDQGLDGCPGYLVTQPVNGELFFDDYGQTDNAQNDCGSPACRSGRDVMFTIDLNHAAWLQITTCGSRFDTYLCVYKDSCCVATQRVFRNDDSPLCGSNSIYAAIDTCFSEPGRYYVVLDGWGVGAWGHYGFHIRTDTTRDCSNRQNEPECPPNYLTHNEDGDEAVCEYAKTTPCPAGWCGLIDPRGDLDVYKFSLTQCSMVTMSLYANDTPEKTGYHNGLNPTLRLFQGAACDHPLYINRDVNTQYNDIVGHDSRIVTQCLPAGDYWCEVSGDTSAGPYEFTIGCTPCPPIPPLTGLHVQNLGQGHYCAGWPAQSGATVYYVWRLNGGPSPILVGTTNTLEFCETVSSDLAPYYMVFTNPCGYPMPAR
jgi:hypothetical protein